MFRCVQRCRHAYLVATLEYYSILNADFDCTFNDAAVQGVQEQAQVNEVVSVHVQGRDPGASRHERPSRRTNGAAVALRTRLHLSYTRYRLV